MRPLSLQIAESGSGGSVVVRCVGEFDLSVEALFAETVTEGVLQNGHASVVLDLSEVTFLDSSGLHALLTARREALGRGSRLVLLAPSAPAVKVLEVSGLANTFEIVWEADSFAS